MNKINIVDSVMGSGKTTAMIDYINGKRSTNKFMFVTPYLDEIDRICKCCKKHGFLTPKEKPSKMSNLKMLLQQGESVAITHALFLDFDAEVEKLIKDGHYILIMDEAINPVKLRVAINWGDLKYLFEKNMIRANKDGTYSWRKSTSPAMAYSYKGLFNRKGAYLYENSVISFYPISIFKAFKEGYVLTYLFRGSPLRSYFNFFKFGYKYMGVSKQGNKYVLSDQRGEQGGSAFKDLIHISDNEFINDIGSLPGSLSKKWYTDCSKEDLDRLKKNCYTYFRKNTRTKSGDNMWTTFSKYKKDISGAGYARGFVVSNAKAINNYKTRTSAAYLIDKYYQEDVRGFYESHGVKFDNDLYATSELVQWIFRGAVRDGKEMSVYIPSKRMRELLIKWLDT